MKIVLAASKRLSDKYMKTKICTKCKRELFATTEFFHKGNAKFGLKSWCKRCRREHTNTDSLPKNYLKYCCKCKKEKPFTHEFFSKHKEGLFGLRSECRECCKEYNKHWRKNNPDYSKHRLEQQKRYRETVKGREVERNACAKYRKTDNGKIKLAAKSAKYRATRLNQMPINADQKEIQSVYKICRDMNKRAGKTLFHVDHITPLCKGGLHYEDNLQVLWWLENVKKK